MLTIDDDDDDNENDDWKNHFSFRPARSQSSHHCYNDDINVARLSICYLQTIVFGIRCDIRLSYRPAASCLPHTLMYAHMMHI